MEQRILQSHFVKEKLFFNLGALIFYIEICFYLPRGIQTALSYWQRVILAGGKEKEVKKERI